MRISASSVVTIAALGAALTAAAPAMAMQPVLFSQTADRATVTLLSGHRADLVLHTEHRPVVVFEERPGTRTATLPEDSFTGLWRGTFRSDAPNAAITGRGASGADYRAIVRITGAARVAGGVRYRVHILRGSLARSLAPANMTIDSVPLSAISLPRPRIGHINPRSPDIHFTVPPTPRPLILDLNHPHPVVQQQPMITATLAGPTALVANVATGPFTASYRVLSWAFGGQAVFTGNPGAVTLSFALSPGQPCALPSPLTYSTQVTGSDGSVATYGPGDPLGRATFTQTVVGGMCFLQWGNLAPPPAHGPVTYSLQQVVGVPQGGSDPLEFVTLSMATLSAV